MKSASTPRPGVLAAASVAALAMVLSGCIASQVTGPSTPEPGPPAPTSLPANYEVTLDPDLKTPTFIYNSDAAGSLHPGDPAPFSNEVAIRIARDFVVRWREVFLFRPGTDDLVAYRAEGRDGQNLVRLRQTYLGVPVNWMEYVSSVIPGGAIGHMSGRFFPGIRISVTPRIDANLAGKRAVDALLPTVVEVDSPPALTVFTDDLTPRLGWSVVVQQPGGSVAGPWRWMPGRAPSFASPRTGSTIERRSGRSRNAGMPT